MKGKRAHREAGGVNEAKEDRDEKTPGRTPGAGPEKEAEERKHGGRAKRKHGGKSEMKVEGEKSHKHMGRKMRKSGGRASSDKNPFTSARSGKLPAGEKVMSRDDDED